MPKQRTGSIKPRTNAAGITVYLAYIGKEYFGTHPTREDAQTIIDAQLYREQGKAKNSFAQLFETYLLAETESAEKRGRGRVFKKEVSLANVHVKSAAFYPFPIKAAAVPKLIQAHIGTTMKKRRRQVVRTGPKKWTTVETEDLVGRRTAQRMLSRVSLFYDAMIIDGLIEAPNPAKLCKLPPAGIDDDDDAGIVFADADEIEALFALPLPPRTRAAFEIATRQGLRPGELLGLHWEDFARLGGSRPEVQVRWSYDGPVKTKNAKRELPLLPSAEEAILRLRDSLPSVPLTGLVFHNRDGKCHGEGYAFGWFDKVEGQGAKRRVAQGWRTRAGIRDCVDFRNLRHTSGSHLLQGTWGPKLSIEEVSKWLGHSSIGVTMAHYASIQTKDGLHSAIERGSRGLRVLDGGKR